MNNFKGLATGIGSLPHTDAHKATDLVLKYVRNIPFWPQLPKRDFREGMVAQFCEGFPGVKVSRDGVFLDPTDKDKDLERFYEELISHNLDYFRITPDFALGLYVFIKTLRETSLKDVAYLKCHITGPFTFAASIRDAQGKMLLHDEVMLQAIIKGLMMKALWQIKLFEEFKKKIIVFIDEPYLGCFGSAYTPINKEDVIGGLTELTEGIKAKDALIGVHCCGNTDWTIFTDTPGIDIINFDAFEFIDKFVLYSDSLKGFLQRGGAICWGIVPTQDDVNKFPPEYLLNKINLGVDALEKKGIPRTLLFNQMLLSPSCGLGSLGETQAEAILRLLSELPSQLK